MSIESVSWMQVACFTLCLLYLLKLPYTVKLLLDKPEEEPERPLIAKLRKELSSHDKYEYWGLGLYNALLIGTMIGGSFFGWFTTFQMTPEINDTEAQMGVFVAFLSLVLHLCAHISLGSAWSGFVSVQKNHQLVTSGMYRFARHPMYSAMLLHSLAIYMISQNWFVGSSVGIPSVYAVYRIAREEVLMVELFGQHYIDYHSKVAALWPWKVCGMDLGITKAEMEGILANRDRKQD